MLISSCILYFRAPLPGRTATPIFIHHSHTTLSHARKCLVGSRGSRRLQNFFQIQLPKIPRISEHVDGTSLPHINSKMDCQTQYSFLELCNTRDLTLFGQVLKSQHCIHQLLPAEKNVTVQLRPRGHNYMFYPYVNTMCMYKNSFVSKCFYNYI
jgi:hypothetical protein